MEIDGTVALVTGAASGLGRATAQGLSEAGAKLVCVDSDGERGRELADTGTGVFVLADVTSAPDIASAVKRATALGPLRVVVNCAGVGWGARIVDRHGEPHDLDLFQRIVGINLVGTFNVLRLAAAAMAANEPNPAGERGVIINTASIAAYEGQIGQAAYAASKSGVVGLTLAAARDLASLGIRVVSIAPGLFDTPMLSLVPEPTRQALTQAMAAPRRFGQTGEYASLVLEIVRNTYLNGETVRLDAGLRMMPR
ncbi:MAG TPA: SDR family NAD(P)-dependent oxidoreductase [Streptosporangiaceae bacterium]|nr:SDR family NAD(P)-dependent oxidoreductase [Streptosporangiaceae bacterium]